MASLLSQYREMRDQYNAQLKENCLPPDSWMDLQELIYRISVLEGFSAYLKTAPVTTETKVMGYHFNMVDYFIGTICSERKFTKVKSDEADKKRKTAQEMYVTVVTQGKKEFQSFKANSDQHYKNSMSKYIETVLCAWVQLRNTFVNIEIKEA